MPRTGWLLLCPLTPPSCPASCAAARSGPEGASAPRRGATHGGNALRLRGGSSSDVHRGVDPLESLLPSEPRFLVVGPRGVTSTAVAINFSKRYYRALHTHV